MHAVVKNQEDSVLNSSTVVVADSSAPKDFAIFRSLCLLSSNGNEEGWHSLLDASKSHFAGEVSFMSSERL